ncbi:hypothetical protein I8D64_12510 [Brachybacterium sp. MASK1Z-5]|uniref:Putative Flp pilus-assembly TadG-like N-terminal domain-containing protein n=1 Tax=Brachybacterium halotolerans TaxID=2795215 RepID=A0ABS1BC55_9MICO|nr:pilus assembly protein TadG-related protein [Brachybacterium halotolerans]MBK0332218.1 hypothetical protein [Brachybacterium halotolerans]
MSVRRRQLGSSSTGPLARLRTALGRDTGTMTVLTTGVLVVILMVIGVGTAITGVQLERNRLQNAADGAALAASQAYGEDSVYEDGPTSLRSTDVRREAEEYLESYPPGSTHTRDIHVEDARVLEDGSVEVRLGAVTDPPLIGWITRTGVITIPLDVSGSARSD